MPGSSYVAASEPVAILLVDDQASNITALEAILGGRAYVLHAASSGIEALKFVEENEYALVLLDVQMPHMDGFETARRMRSMPRSQSTPIVFVTAIYPAESFATKGYESGAVDYLFKPLNPDILRAKVAVFVELFRKTREVERQGKLLQDRSERRYKGLVESIPRGVVWAADPESLTLSFVSSRAEALTGWGAKHWMEPGFFRRHVVDVDWPVFEHTIEQARKSGSEVEVEHRFMRPGGEVIWLQTSLRVTKDSDEDKLELRGISFDVTRLKQAIQIRDDFLSIASHELKTPLTPLQFQMQGFMRLMRKGKFEHAPRENLREMLLISDAQVSRLGRLIDELLDVSRLRSGQVHLALEEMDLSESIRQTVDQFRFEIEESECELRLELCKDLRGHWDRLRIEQMTANLLANALKYGAHKPVTLSLARSGDFAVLKIQDEGIGIGLEDQERIFERFERAASSRHYGGLGLGLYITRQIVELHGGQISVQSESGRGAVFEVRLPVHPLGVSASSS
jgi:PAS domain S-box-containing protein